MRIAIVNDLTMAQEAIRRVLNQSGEHEIAWTAAEGSQALERCRRDRPDLILMDLIMPGMNGVEATRRIMAECPCAIVVVTANFNESCSEVFAAMGAGALDVVNTPVMEWPGSCKGSSELLAKIETIRRLLVLPRTTSAQLKRVEGEPNGRLIAIGASAGGPAALARILSYFPATMRSSIVIVQHVDAMFASALANWLDDQTPLRVRLAEQGDAPTPGTVLLAGRDRHLVLTEERTLALREDPADCLYRPSVDVFFESIPRNWPGSVTGVLLTGMGRDGAKGLLGLREAGHHTIAQEQSSCAVYGMPKAAADLDAASEILGLEQIGLRLRALGTQSVQIHV